MEKNSLNCRVSAHKFKKRRKSSLHKLSTLEDTFHHRKSTGYQVLHGVQSSNSVEIKAKPCGPVSPTPELFAKEGPVCGKFVGLWICECENQFAYAFQIFKLLSNLPAQIKMYNQFVSFMSIVLGMETEVKCLLNKLDEMRIVSRS